MKMVYPEWTHQIEFVEGKTQILVIENQALFYDFVKDLYSQCNDGIEGKVVLSEEAKILSISKQAYICVNMLDLDVNSKKVLTKLYNELKSDVYDEELYVETNDIMAEIERYCNSIADKSLYNLEYDLELDISGLFKYANIRIQQEEEGILGRILNYIEVMHTLLKLDLAIFVNLKSYLSNDECKKLYEMVQYWKVTLLLIENHCEEERSDDEVVYLIDKDGCEIY